MSKTFSKLLESTFLNWYKYSCNTSTFPHKNVVDMLQFPHKNVYWHQIFPHKSVTMEREIYKRLIEWKNKSARKPLILEGARQVGKTYILQAFGLNEYDNMIYITCQLCRHRFPYLSDSLCLISSMLGKVS